ncbi:MAG: type II toxin-antitoxin system VapC family toxin [Chloroflexi bacterium]|nr:type II toxin-antitoxin system VapC family toxin [Chloroflexota bacterium]
MAASQVSQVILVDTDVFSYMRRNRPEATPYLQHLSKTIPALSFSTVAELYQWAFKSNWSPANVSKLKSDLRKFLILPYDETVAEQWASIQTAIPGRRFPVNDAWTAACALAYGCPILTHNRKDFQDVPGLFMISYAPEL